MGFGGGGGAPAPIWTPTKDPDPVIDESQFSTPALFGRAKSMRRQAVQGGGSGLTLLTAGLPSALDKTTLLGG